MRFGAFSKSFTQRDFTKFTKKLVFLSKLRENAFAARLKLMSEFSVPNFKTNCFVNKSLLNTGDIKGAQPTSKLFCLIKVKKVKLKRSISLSVFNFWMVYY